MQRGEDEDKAENEAKTLAAKEEGNTVERLDAIHLRSLAAPVKNTVVAAAAKEDADNSNNNDNADMNDAQPLPTTKTKTVATITTITIAKKKTPRRSNINMKKMKKTSSFAPFARACVT